MKVYDLDTIIESIGYNPLTRKYWVEKTLSDGFILSHESIYKEEVIKNISRKYFRHSAIINKRRKKKNVNRLQH